MLSEEDNQLLTRVGPGTPMGSLMRQYWLPALLSSELPEPDCCPVRLVLLCEQLIAFRDTAGRAGLLANHCPHRGSSLFFGRNEAGGIRCAYHGWKFDVTGRCLEMPNEPAQRGFQDRTSATAYPCRERGGIVWAYLGPRRLPPPLPDLEANMLSDGEVELAAFARDCNWLQALEGDIDTRHIGFLHFGGMRPEDAPEGSFMRLSVADRLPRLDPVDTDVGVMYAALRSDPAWFDCRIVQFLLPFYTMLEPGVLGVDIGMRAWVPMDDEHLMFFGVNKVRAETRRDRSSGRRRGFELIPNSSDWFGRFRPEANAHNDYFVDREKQRRGDFTGITGIPVQDAAATESMGPIGDRRVEHLGASDAMIIRVRQRIIAAARALAERGVAPPGVDDPTAYAVRSGGVLLPKVADWITATEQLRAARA